MQMDVNNEENTGYDETSLLSGQPNDHKEQTTGKNISVRVIFTRSRSFLHKFIVVVCIVAGLYTV